MKKIWFIFVLLLIVMAAPCGSSADDEDTYPQDGTFNPPPEPRTVLLTGSAGYDIPIEVPAGRAGVEPVLTISYNSYLRDGWLGRGWQLNGLGAIARSSKWGLDYDAHDFEAIGQELVAHDTDSNGNGEYRALINERFTRYEFNNNSGWQVTEKDGIQYHYGTSSQSRHDNEHGTYAWYLDRIQDPNGNYLTVSYIQDQGEYYPDQISYTGNDFAGTGPAYKVRFHYEQRTDQSTSYATHSKVVNALRLMTLTVWSGDNLVRAYKIDYDNTLNAPLTTSYLKAVTEYGSDVEYDGNFRITGGSKLLPFIASYTAMDASQGIDFSSVSVPSSLSNQSGGALGLTPLDYDGDGKTDLCRSIGGKIYLFRSTGASFSEKSISPLPSVSVNGNETRWIIYDYHPADFNGDGLTDILVYASRKAISSSSCCPQTYKYKYIYQQKLLLSTGDDFEIVDVEIGSYYGKVELNRRQVKVDYGDFNGDGRTDIYFQYDYYWYYQSSTNNWKYGLSNGWRIYLANDKGFDRVAHDGDSDSGSNLHNRPSYPSTTVDEYKTGDFNGDGRTDLILHGTENGAPKKNGYDILYFIGNDFEKVYSGGWPSSKDRIVPGDYNGDGKTDLLVTANSDTWNGNRLLLSTGTGFVESSSSSNPSYNANLHPADFNGDGRTDFLAVPRATRTFTSSWPGYKIYLSNGSGFELVVEKNAPNFSYYESSSSTTYRYNFLSYDFNGDGFPDFFATKHYGNKYASMGLYLADIDQGQHLDPNLPNLLATLDNGRGGRHRFAYRPSSSYDNDYLPFVKPVVSQMTTSDGTGNEAVTGYDYLGGYFKKGTRDFLGFKQVTTTLPDGRSEKTWYHQDNDADKAADGMNSIRAAIPPSYYDQPDSYYKHGKPIAKISYQAGSDTKISEIQYDWSTDPTGQSYFVMLESKKTHQYDDSDNPYLSMYENYTYDDQQGNLEQKMVSSSDPDTETITTTYDYKNCAAWLWRTTQEHIEGSDTGLARRTDYDFDGKGNLILEEHYNDNGDNPTIAYRPDDYDDYGNRLIEKDFNGNETSFTYDPVTNSKIESITNPKGHVQHFFYHPLYGTPESGEDPNGNYTQYTYDIFGRLESMEIYDQNNTLQAKTELSHHFNAYPNYIKKSVWETSDGTTTDSYRYFDGLGRTIQTVSTGENGQFIVNRIFFDTLGRQTDTIGPYFSDNSTPGILYEIDPQAPHTWTESFDQRDRPEVVKTADQGRDLTTIYSYQGLATTTTDPDGAEKTALADGHGRIRKIIEDPDGIDTVTTYRYNAAGDLLTVTDAKDQQITLGVNTLGQKTFMSDPDLGDWHYRYDLNGNLEWQKDAKDQEIQFGYDSLNRILSKTYLNPGPYDHDVAYEYDNPQITQDNPLGHLSRVTNSMVTSNFTDYDAQGRPRSETKTISGDTARTTVYKLDLAGKPICTIYPDGHEAHVDYYPGSGLIKQVWSPDSEGRINYVTYQNYPATGKIHQAAFHNNVETIYDYCPYSNRLNKIRTHLSGTDYINREYSYTPAGDIENINDQVTYNTRFYVYDKLHRLTSEYASNDTYSYLTPSIMDYTYDSDKPYHAVSTITNLGDLHSFSYDNNGNLTQGADLTSPDHPATRELIYNADNMPVKITHSTNGVTELVYDHDQKRAKKTTPAGTTYYINKLFEVTPQGVVKYIFAGNNRIAVIKPQGAFYIHPDHLSSATVMTNENGELVDKSDYLPYGGQRGEGIYLIDYRFTDQELDAESGLYNYDARLYDPIVGRFVSADTIVPNWYDPQVLNRYAYCRNNPLLYVDPRGHIEELFYDAHENLGNYASYNWAKTKQAFYNGDPLSMLWNGYSAAANKGVSFLFPEDRDQLVLGMMTLEAGPAISNAGTFLWDNIAAKVPRFLSGILSKFTIKSGVASKSVVKSTPITKKSVIEGFNVSNHAFRKSGLGRGATEEMVSSVIQGAKKAGTVVTEQGTGKFAGNVIEVYSHNGVKVAVDTTQKKIMSIRPIDNKNFKLPGL